SRISRRRPMSWGRWLPNSTGVMAPPGRSTLSPSRMVSTASAADRSLRWYSSECNAIPPCGRVAEGGRRNAVRLPDGSLRHGAGCVFLNRSFALVGDAQLALEQSALNDVALTGQVGADG